jgi:OH-DDVA meta-cleavage compound hydrolase
VAEQVDFHGQYSITKVTKFAKDTKDMKVTAVRRPAGVDTIPSPTSSRRQGVIIDSHGHVTAPDSLYVYKAQILAHRGAHGRGGTLATEHDVREALHKPVFGGSSHLDQLKEVGTDMQLISPRPYQMMTSEHPKLVQWFTEETNNIIAKQVELYPNTFRGVCGLPLTPGVSPKTVLPYLEKCVKEQGFVGCLLNPDPGECGGIETPPLGDRFWYPLYEKLVELDIPGHIHSTGCSPTRCTSSTRRASASCRCSRRTSSRISRP